MTEDWDDKESAEDWRLAADTEVATRIKAFKAGIDAIAAEYKTLESGGFPITPKDQVV